MKREREEVLEDMVDCLMLLSKVGQYNKPRPEREESRRQNNFPAADSGKVFVCKTCNREFSSFQALGGHRASHRNPKFMDVTGGQDFNPHRPPAKSKTHVCSVCGLQFPIGQALGGHMRRHRTTAAVVKKSDGRGERVFGVDLNLTPVENNLKFQLVTPFIL